MMDLNEADSMLRSALKKSRYIHSIGVAREAKEMAEIFGADPEKAYIAGLLHDCAKSLSPDAENELIERAGLKIDKASLMCRPVLHAPLGAVLAEIKYGVTDAEILDAIRYHTVARAGMTPLDKIIYVADMTEPGRSYEGVGEVRRASRKDLDAAFCLALGRSIIFNIKKGSLIHTGSIEAWNFLINEGRC